MSKFKAGDKVCICNAGDPHSLWAHRWGEHAIVLEVLGYGEYIIKALKDQKVLTLKVNNLKLLTPLEQLL